MANSSSRNRELKLCIFLEPDSPELPSKFVVFEIVLRQANADNRDTCAFVANLLILLNFGFKDMLTNRLAELGITEIKTVKIPSQAEEYMIDYHVERYFSLNDTYVIFGCTVLILFKNISRANYDNFMTKRIKAMCSNVPCSCDDEMQVPYTFSEAESIRSMLVSSMPVKQAVIRFLISFSDRSGCLMAYLCGFLAWSDMYAYKVMHDTLILRTLGFDMKVIILKAVVEGYRAKSDFEFCLLLLEI